MIRPYLTVLKDSFHEAFASRVLWILLVGLTLILLALAPVGLKEKRFTQFRQNSIRDFSSLAERIKQQSEDSKPSPGKRIWELAGDPFKQTINSATGKPTDDDQAKGESNNNSDNEAEKPPISRDSVSALLDQFNELLSEPALYDQAAWSDVSLNPTTTELLDAGPKNLSVDDLALLNYSLVKAAFPAEIANAPEKALYFSYFIWTVEEPLPFDRETFRPVLNQILAGVMDFLVGTIAVFVAILVTAPIIPNTFEAGAIDLLLSKPVARPLLFLVKFLGGCAFILLNAGYFVIGLWLIVGLRLGLWNNNLLLCIPIFLFLFLIYYSVSAFAAVRWKNTVVSIVITILFWAACFTVGAAKGVIEQFAVNPHRLVNIVPSDEALLAVNQSGRVVEWRGDQWETVLQPSERRAPSFIQQTLVGPVYDAKQNRLMYLQPPPSGRFRLFAPRPSLMIATWSDGSWKQDTGPAAPVGSSWLFASPHGEIIVIAPSGLHRLEEKPDGSPDRFKSLGPEPSLSLAYPFGAAMHPVSGDVVVYSSRSLTILHRQQDGTYRRGEAREFDKDEYGQSAALAFAGNRILAAFSSGQVVLLDAANLATFQESRPAGENEPYIAAAASNGQWLAVLFHNRKLFLYDAETGDQRKMGSGASAVVFDNNDLLVADRADRVTRYKLGSFDVEDRHQPSLGVFRVVYYYGILPTYTIFPKPGELGNVVHYLLTDQETVAMGPSSDAGLRQARAPLNVYGPIWSSLAFVAVMLAITCFYIRRLDI